MAMSLATFLHRVRRTSWSERLILAEAVGALAVAALAIRLFSFKTLAAAAGSVGQGRESEAQSSTIERVRWAIKATAPYLPWKTLCFQEGLALHSMLRRRGVASFLHYGVGQSVKRGLSAHVWVSIGGRILIGEEGAGDHACLATFPAVADRP
jgi:hypothetical protein